MPRPAAYAALDLGTNNCRLLVAARRGAASSASSMPSRASCGWARGCRPAAGSASSHGPRRRGAEGLRRKAAPARVRKARLIATEACRSAENGVEFLARVKAETGLELEIIDRETEARLAVSGCGSLVERDTRAWCCSTSAAAPRRSRWSTFARRSPRLANHIAAWTSLPVGVVSLAERFGGRHVTPEIFEAMVADVGEMLAPFAGRNPAGDHGGRPLPPARHVGHGDHAGRHPSRTAALRPAPGRRAVDGAHEVDAMIERLLGWNYDERVANPCIGPDRADLVLAGCAILQAIRRAWPSERLRVADRGLREGMLSELMAEDGAWRRGRGARIASHEEGLPAAPGARALKTRLPRRRSRTSSRRWLERQLNDPYVHRAQAEGYRSRAAYKLIEIDDRYKLLKPGQRVVDLGAAPGGWCQVAAARVNGSPEAPAVVGIDYLDVDAVPGAIILKMDFLDDDAPQPADRGSGRRAGHRLSDMAAPTTGHRRTDHIRTMHLCEVAADFAISVLKPGGHFLAKTFQGGTEGGLLDMLKKNFTSVHHVKPPASREESVELYILAKGLATVSASPLPMRCSATSRARNPQTSRRQTSCRAGIDSSARVSSLKPARLAKPAVSTTWSR
jgi:23S rRNA (uridine2552-2'-O)-methyltransferase